MATLLTGVVNLPLLWFQSSESKETSNSTTFNVTHTLGSEHQISSEIHNYGSSFPLLLVIRILGFISMDSACSLLDASGLVMTKKYHGDFGLQKMWSMASIVIIPPLCGLAVDGVSSYLGKDSYHEKRNASSNQPNQLLVSRIQRLLDCSLYFGRIICNSRLSPLEVGNQSREEPNVFVGDC